MKKHLRACKKNPTNLIQRLLQPSPISRGRRRVPTYSLTAAILAGYARIVSNDVGRPNADGVHSQYEKTENASTVDADIEASLRGLVAYGETEQELTPDQAEYRSNDYPANTIDDATPNVARDAVPAIASSTHNIHSNRLLSATSMQSLYKVSYAYDNQMRAGASISKMPQKSE